MVSQHSKSSFVWLYVEGFSEKGPANIFGGPYFCKVDARQKKTPEIAAELQIMFEARIDHN